MSLLRACPRLGCRGAVLLRRRRVFAARRNPAAPLRLVALLLIAVLFTPGVFGQEKTAAPASVIYPRATDAQPAAGSGSSAGYNSVLLVAIVLAAAAGWLFWRARLAPGAVAALRKLSIAETKSLGNRQYLVVASYEDKKFLLGVCPGRIDLLTPLEGDAPSRRSS